MARVTVDLGVLRRNARATLEVARGRGLEVVAVLKNCDNFAPVFELLRREGVTTFGFFDGPPPHARAPLAGAAPARCLRIALSSPHEADEVVEHFDLSLQSEMDTALALAAAAGRRRKKHGIYLMIDVGDRREGLLPERASHWVRSFARHAPPFLELLGFSVNYGCLAGVLPHDESIATLVHLADEAVEFGLLERPTILLGGSAVLQWVRGRSGLDPRIAALRSQESLLFGNVPGFQVPLYEGARSPFRILGQVVELKTKPNMPVGPLAPEGFGAALRELPARPDFGARAIVNFGEIHTDPHGLTPVDAGLTLVGASTYYCVLNVGEGARRLRVGDTLEFEMNYWATLRAFLFQRNEFVAVPG
jgi:predicted amino acid racemase